MGELQVVGRFDAGPNEIAQNAVLLSLRHHNWFDGEGLAPTSLAALSNIEQPLRGIRVQIQCRRDGGALWLSKRASATRRPSSQHPVRGGR